MPRFPFRRLIGKILRRPEISSACAAVVQALESRLFLTTVPGLNLSAGAVVTVTGSPGAQVITVAGGAASFDQNLGSSTTPDWNNATVNAVNGADIVLNTA